MQRIKLEVFKSLFEKDLTGNEIDFLLVLSFYQDQRGCVRGVYYKQMMEEAKMSVQAFYDCKNALEKKGVITSVRVHNDYDIWIIGNDFTSYTQEDYAEGRVKYLSTSSVLFRDRNFKALKPKQKLLAMDLLNIQSAGVSNGVQAYRIRRENFIKKYANTVAPDGSIMKGILDITVRTLQKYLKMLKLYFSIGLKEGIYYFTLRKAFGKRAVTGKTEKETAMEQMLTAACRRNKVKAPDPKECAEILKVLTYREKDILKYSINISTVIERMIEVINARIINPKKWSRRLKTSLFVKLLNEETV